jgi:hypothetical protein
MLASMQQWMIGLGIMVAVSGYRETLVVQLTMSSSNGPDMGAPFVEVLSPGAFHCPSKSYQPLSSPVVSGFSPSLRDGSLKKAERSKAALFSHDST